nr:Nuclear GTPase SLIP-GC 3 [Colletotrichum truncatum]KAF6797219.1 Nuclear GTPase SLIP-GC 3 [Colletotrichum truncatum]
MTRYRKSSSKVPSASTSTSSRHSPTPSTDSTPEFPSIARSEGTPVFRVSPSKKKDGPARQSSDDPLPTIEGGPRSPTISVTSNDGTYVIQTPTTSVAPSSPSSSSHGGTSSPFASPKIRSRQGNGETESLTRCMDNMNLTSQRSPFVMVDVAIAISGIANNSEQQPSRVEASNPNLRMTSLSPRPPERPRRISRTVLSKHDVKDEEVPPNRFHDPKVQEAFRNAKALMSRLADALGSSPLHINPDSTIRQLHRQAQKLAHFQPPSTRTVGFVGDSGVGKSSLLNSLLDLEGLARTSNSGAACTCVVTEYHFHDQTDFITYVELFSVDDLVKQAEDLLKSYRHYHLNSDEMEGNELSDFKEQAQVALDTFRAMFRGRYDDEEFLTEDRLKVALRTLKSRVVELRPSEIEGRQVDTNLQDCSTRLMRLTSEVASSREPALWPYIKKIKVSLNSHILSKGLVLVDLPGLRDLNSARRAITERYLIECDEIFAICNIGRATTDVGVASVFDLAKEAGLENVGIVCTKSDVSCPFQYLGVTLILKSIQDIRAAEAKKDWKGPRARKVQQLSDAVAATQRQLDDINLDLADFEDADDLSEEERNLIIDLGFRAKKTQ